MSGARRASRLIISLAALACLCPACLAAENDDGRYSMSPTDDGVVRLDKRTGAMAHCTRKQGAWACEDMQDSQGALMAEIDRLEAENTSLKTRVEHLEETLGLSDGQKDQSMPGNELALPSEQDVDKAFDFLERMLKKLHERMEKLKEEHSRKPGRAL